MALQIKIDQSGKPSGVSGQAREDLATGTAVDLELLGAVSPLAFEWSIIDKPPNDGLTAHSLAALTTPTSATTQLTPIDNVGTYLIECKVDQGFGLGARAEDVVRITFYAGPTLNVDPTQLPRRVPSFLETIEHNAPDVLDPSGNPEGWAREWRRWFKVIQNLSGGSSLALLIRSAFDSSGIVAPPGAMAFRLDNADPTLAQTIFVHDLNVDGSTIDPHLLYLPAGSFVFIRNDDVSVWHRYKLTAAAVDQSGYVELPVVHDSGSVAGFSNGVVYGFELDADSGEGASGELAWTISDIAAVDNGSYGDTFTADFDLATLWPEMPDNCIVTGRISWSAGPQSGTTAAVQDDIGAWIWFQASYNNRVLLQVKDASNWGGSQTNYGRAIIRTITTGLGLGASDFVQADSSGGNIRSVLRQADAMVATIGSATLRIESVQSRNLLTA